MLKLSPQDLNRLEDARSKVKQNICQSHHSYISEVVAVSLNDSPKYVWSYIRPYIEKKQAFLLLV